MSRSISILLRADKIAAAPAAFIRQYTRDGQALTPRWASVIAALQLLGPTPTAEQINQTIGNKSWTSLECYFCEQDVERAILLQGYDHSLTICGCCLGKAQILLAGKWEAE